MQLHCLPVRANDLGNRTHENLPLARELGSLLQILVHQHDFLLPSVRGTVPP